MYRTDFWTLWEKARVGCFKRTVSKHVYYLGWNRSPAQAWCMRQVLGPGAPGRPRGIGWRGRWEGWSGWGIHVYPRLIHVNVWQKPLQYCKVISLQLIKINKKIKQERKIWQHWLPLWLGTKTEKEVQVKEWSSGFFMLCVFCCFIFVMRICSCITDSNLNLNQNLNLNLKWLPCLRLQVGGTAQESTEFKNFILYKDSLWPPRTAACQAFQSMGFPRQEY